MTKVSSGKNAMKMTTLDKWWNKTVVEEEDIDMEEEQVNHQEQ